MSKLIRADFFFRVFFSPSDLSDHTTFVFKGGAIPGFF